MDIQKIMFAQLAQKALFDQAKAYAFDYIDNVQERSVFPEEEALNNLDLFELELPQVPQSGEAILQQLHKLGSPATVAQTGGRYFGFVNGNAIPTALAARWLSDVWDQNPALHVISPIVAKLEGLCEKWSRELLGLPEETVAGIVSGTSIATLCGLAAGRWSLLQNMGWDVNEDGLFGAPPVRVVVSEQAHGTVFKALALLGLGKKRVELVPSDTQGRIRTDKIPPLDDKTLLILQAGNVNTGAFDDFEHICARAREVGSWVHVDGAFGLWAAASPKHRHLTKGIEWADSWSVDGHKTLNTPYDCAMILCKNTNALVASMQATGSYIQYGEKRDNMMYTPEMSRRARAVELWASLYFLGKDGVAGLIEGLCERAKQFGELLKEHHFHIQNDIVFNQVLLKCDSPQETQETLKNIQASGECWCGGTTWFGEPAIRISVCSWATTPDDVQRSVNAFVAARDKARESKVRK